MRYKILIFAVTELTNTISNYIAMFFYINSCIASNGNDE